MAGRQIVQDGDYVAGLEEGFNGDGADISGPACY
jgi:hypothetical protein